MDGRWIRKWLLASCVIPGALGCKTTRTPWDAPAGTASGMPSVSDKKSIWDSTKTSVPVEVAIEPKKGPPAPATLVAIADLQLERALDDKAAVANRQELLDTARQGYQKALQQDPKNSTAMIGLARFYTRLGEREKAVDEFKKYLTIYPTDKVVAHEVAVAHAQWKDWAGAISWCEFALKIDPENLSTRKTMAFCYARAGKWEDGLRVMMQVMPEAPARFQIARAMDHQNDVAGCKAQLELALKADPNFADARDYLIELEHPSQGTAPDSGILQTGFTEPIGQQQYQQPQQVQPPQPR
ncbi:MAG: tetratricopeptide repeat protein [Planctomycetes bacterium]|nr:tetratricopeptide repeat protein [Planctomycetota bacterium]